eukprot:TRINITY_DN7792_c0_g3_i5.p3 TRINITY_DN7792_c0_g3~~TRINITY_DN7792_c0_g3_i5.p3  ORF type:complete len:107 (+),score=0.66 TRINITY_DN7792_c0_g3_i5:164-484(+)
MMCQMTWLLNFGTEKAPYFDWVKLNLGTEKSRSIWARSNFEFLFWRRVLVSECPHLYICRSNKYIRNFYFQEVLFSERHNFTQGIEFFVQVLKVLIKLVTENMEQG